MNLKLDNIIMDPSNDKFKDECGVFGIYSNNPLDVASVTYYGLYALQHRGQESAGIAVANGEDINIKKGMGLITEAFSQEDIDSLKGFAAIGHVRYSTSGDTRIENAQPLLSQTKLGPIAMAHNGTLVNADVIRELLEDGGHIFHTSIDSEVIANLIARGAKRLGLEEGTELKTTVFELSYKDDSLGDPLINHYHAVAIGATTFEELEKIYSLTAKINDILKDMFLKSNIRLIDFKLEFGRYNGDIVLADEISPDTCRFWDATTGEKLDKDRFRRDLGNVKDAYVEILKRIQE